jgi:hypothetical protein
MPSVSSNSSSFCAAFVSFSRVECNSPCDLNAPNVFDDKAFTVLGRLTVQRRENQSIQHSWHGTDPV